MKKRTLLLATLLLGFFVVACLSSCSTQRQMGCPMKISIDHHNHQKSDLS